MDNIIIRNENSGDYFNVENLVRESFWDVYRPGCSEHLVVHNLRESADNVPELAYVMEKENKIVGYIIYSKANLISNESEMPIICMGPVAVSPELQGLGIGSRLINHSIEIAKSLGHKAIVLLGNPSYYKRFRFEPASKYGIVISDGSSFDEFMILFLDELNTSVAGKVVFSKIFDIDKNELEIFDEKFPAKEKHRLPTQIFSE